MLKHDGVQKNVAEAVLRIVEKKHPDSELTDVLIKDKGFYYIVKYSTRPKREEEIVLKRELTRWNDNEG